MASNQIVLIKGQLDGSIDIILDESADFSEIKESLQSKISKGKSFFKDAESVVSFKGRNISDDEEQQLIDIIIQETELDITFIRGGWRKDTGILTKTTTPPEPMLARAAQVKTSYMESNTAYYKTGLRGGQSIKFEGSVVIMGDVNPGSEVVANGNVIILGALKGMAHAGAGGDDTCFVSALDLKPTQLRIAETISYVPKSDKKGESTPAYAHIKNGQVFVSPL